MTKITLLHSDPIRKKWASTDFEAAIPYSRPPPHPLFPALEKAEHGSLRVIAPDGHSYLFTGSKLGPEAQMHIHHWNALDALLGRGEIGFGKSYAKGEWDTDDLPSLVMYGISNADALERYFYGKPWYALWQRLRCWWESNSLTGSRRNISKHYDLGNNFYSLWLDKSMTYSSGLFGGDSHLSLEEAQLAKYGRIMAKLAPNPGTHILDIGCGWGGFAEFAAHQGFRVTGITISPAQKAYAEERLQREGLSHLARIYLQDYRQLSDYGQFDCIASIGMFEHVGKRYWPTYFKTVASLLQPGGTAVIQSILLDEKIFASSHHQRGFVEQIIFPGSCVPSKERFCAAAVKAGLVCREVFTFGNDYALTLQAWLKRFEEKKPQIRLLGYDEYFIRLWRFYLASCISSFTAGRTNVMQAEIIHDINFSGRQNSTVLQ